MKNMTELTQVASDMAKGLLDGSIDVKTAIEANNAIGKAIAAAKVTLAYEIVKRSAPDLKIAYLEGSSVEPIIDIKQKPRKLRQG